jgi:putative tricarboxylic transport membrane protein
LVDVSPAAGEKPAQARYVPSIKLESGPRFEKGEYMSASATARRVIASAVLGVSAVSMPAAGQPAWKPEKNVEIVVGTSAGGGQDTSARFVQKLLSEKQLVNVSTSVVNKPGGGSSIGYSYLNQHPGDGHYIMLLTVPLITNHVLGLSPIAHTDLTPLATLFEDYIVASVLPNSAITNGRDLLDRLKKDPSAISVGVPSLTGGGNFAIALAARAAGVDPRKLKTVVFKSGGDSVTALLGGHIAVMMSTTAAPVRQRRAGKLRMLAIASPERLSGELADVPTWREQGVNVVFSNWRGMVGPRGLSAAQIAYWEEVFTRLVATEEFKSDLQKNQWVSRFLRSAQMRQFLAEQHDEIKTLLTELGMVK